MACSIAKFTRPCPPTPHFTSQRSILILSSNLRLGLPSGLLPLPFPTKALYAPLFSSYMLHALPILVFLILSRECYLLRSTQHKAPCYVVFSTHVTSSLLGPNTLLSTLFSKPLSLHPPLMWATKFRIHINNRQYYSSVQHPLHLMYYFTFCNTHFNISVSAIEVIQSQNKWEDNHRRWVKNKFVPYMLPRHTGGEEV